MNFIIKSALYKEKIFNIRSLISLTSLRFDDKMYSSPTYMTSQIGGIKPPDTVKAAELSHSYDVCCDSLAFESKSFVDLRKGPRFETKNKSFRIGAVRKLSIGSPSDSPVSFNIGKRLRKWSTTSDSDYNGSLTRSLTGLNIRKRLRKWSQCNRKQFGTSLEDIRRSHSLPVDWPIPPILIKCVAFLSVPENLVIEGIFRKSPRASKVKELQVAVDCGKETIFEGENMVMLVAELLKTFFRELPEPLLTFYLFDNVTQFLELPMKKRPHFVAQSLQKLPDINYVVLRYLLKFLSMVSIYL